MRMMKRNYINASSCPSNTIKIPYSRLKDFVKKGDQIRGFCSQFPTSGAEFIVTHIAWWGVFAIPTQKFMEAQKFRTDINIKCHVKFKWVNIFGIIFME